MESKHTSTLLVGLAQVDITPPPGTPMAGYIRRQAPSQGVLDPLFARVLYLNDGHTAVALVVLDILLVDQVLRRLIQEQVAGLTDLPGERVLVAATHTHSGPSGLGVLSFGGDHDQDLLARTVSQIAGCVLQARDSSFTAVLKSGSTTIDGFSQCRLDPQRPIESQLHLLRIEDTQGRLKGVFANFPCHPTFLSYDNLFFSADWVGETCRVAAAALGEEVVVMLTNGASGDIHPLYLSQTPADLQRMGQILGGAMISLVGKLRAAGEQLKIHNMRWGLRLQQSPLDGRRIEQPRLRLLQTEVVLPLKEYLDPEVYEAKVNKISAQLVAKGVPASDLAEMVAHPGFTSPDFSSREPAVRELLAQLNKLAGERLERARVLNLFPHSRVQMFQVHLLQIDADLAFLFFPGELANWIGLHLKEKSGFSELVIVSYGNDYIGYLVSEEDFNVGGYDVGVSHFPATGETLFIKKILAWLARLDVAQVQN